MACITIPSTHDTRVEMLTIPYLTTTYEEAKEVFFPGRYFLISCSRFRQKKVCTFWLFILTAIWVLARKAYSESHGLYRPQP